MRPMQIIAVVLLLAVAAVGQTNKGGISGTVLDQNGAAIPGATVTVTNAGTGQKQTLTTSESGAFSAQSLDPVVYDITVEAQGFKTATLTGLKVDTSAIATANVTMEAGAVGESVTVVADAPIINAETGAASTTITERQIQDVPLNNRSVLDLALTAPGVTGDAGSEDPGVSTADGQPVPGFNLSVNGGRPGSTAILADGVNNTGVGIARAVISFTPETVQEFTVQTSAFSAEYGNTGGGTINITTKSGTNDFNGVALWYHRNPKFNATPFTTSSAARPPSNLRYNQVSITAGGPVFLPRFGEGGPRLYDGHDKTFFFFAYEPRWRQDFNLGTGRVPGLAERTGDFRNLVRTTTGIVPADVAARLGLSINGNANIYQQFIRGPQGQLLPITLAAGNQFCQFNDPRRALVNQTYTIDGVQTVLPTPQCNATINQNPNPELNVIPQEFLDPIGLRIASLMPQPGNYFLDNGTILNYVLPRSISQNETRWTYKIDHNFTDKFKTAFRYTSTPAVGIRSGGSGDINGNQGVYSDAKQYLLTFNNIVTPTLVNDLRINYTRGNFSEDFSPEFSIVGGRNVATELGLPSLTQGGIPNFQFGADSATYDDADVGSSLSTNNFNVEERFNINDIVYWTRGNQTWKFGVDLNQARLNVIPYFAGSGGRWQFRTINTSNNRAGGTTVTSGGNPVASLLLGVPNDVDIRPRILDYNYEWKSGAAFVQNDWKLRPNFTLNLGLRYSLQYPRVEKNNLQGVFRPDLAETVTLTDAQRQAIATGLGLPITDEFIPTEATLPPFAFSGMGGRSKYVTPVDYRGIEPRFGFAWQPKMKIFGFDTEQRALVIRGGYGISHAPITGNNRSPNPDFGGFTNVSTNATGSSGTVNTNQPIRLTGNTPLQQARTSILEQFACDADGVCFNSLSAPGFVSDPGSGKVPYTQTWNLTTQFEAYKGIVVEFSYTGNKGTNLYMPVVNINRRDVEFISHLESQGLDATTTLADPLGRRNSLGAVITVPRATVVTPYLGYDRLQRFFDPSANSIRHAAYVDVRRRVARGLTFTANYTYAKSIDDASDATPDVRVLTTGASRGHVTHGAPRSADRSISTFDVKNNFSSTFVWDLPVGRRGGSRGWLLGDVPGPINTIIGGWTMSGVFRMPGGTPFLPFITDPNKLGSTNLNRTVRLDIVEGVPLRNPLWDRDCPSGTNSQTGRPCEPFINPSAFMRPAKGQLGNAPRTVDIRSPRQEYFDLSMSKDFPWPFANKDGKRRINFRIDAINLFNHPNFRFVGAGNTPPGFGTFPTELTGETQNGVTQPITIAQYNTWATAWNSAHPNDTVPIQSTAANAPINGTLQTIRNNVNATRLPPRAGTVNGALPLDFFRVQIPQGFATATPESFDLRTLEGFKHYRLRQTYDSNFGTLEAVRNPRYIQFGLRIFF